MLLSVGVAVAHSYLGERYILIRLFRRTDLPQLLGSDVFTRRTLRFAWHLTSITWIGIAVALWQLERGSARGGVLALAAMFLVSAVVTFVGSRGRHLAWIAFLAIAAAAWAGAPAP